MSLPFDPAVGRLVIEPVVKEKVNEKVTTSGIILPKFGNDEEKLTTGTVVAAPEDSAYPVGSFVVYSPYAGFTIRIDDKPYVLVSEHEILGKTRAKEAYVQVD